MSNNYILGSGITGLLARFILGDDWTVIPFYKSRFYSFKPTLCDNFIIADPQIDGVISALGLPTSPTSMARAYSSQGNLFKTDPGGALATAWLHKLFDGDPPLHALPYMKARTSVWIYDKARVNLIYSALLERYGADLKREAQLPQVTAIRDHRIERGATVQEYGKVVSTVPLNVLTKLLGVHFPVRHKPIHYIHMHASSLNFEGASQAFVVDPLFSFFKVSAITKNRYLFYCHENIPDPGRYFMPIIPGEYDLIDGTMVPDALPLGQMPNLGFLDEHDVFAVGSYAQHDWCADVGSNMLKLLRYGGRDFTPKKPTVIG